MRLLINEKEKLPENDSPVIIEDGVGVEENVIILKGVTVERGSVIAAGCVANKSITYLNSAGIPVQTIRLRFTIEEILEHIIPEEERLPYSQ